MYKKIIVMMLLGMVCINGCQKAENGETRVGEKPDYTVEDLARTIYCNVELSTELSEVEEEIAKFYFGLDESTDVKLLMSNAGSEMVAVFSHQGDDMGDILAAAEEFLANQRAAFNGYSPEDVKRIDEAVISTMDSYAVVVVCDDPVKTKQALEDIFAGEIMLLQETMSENESVEPDTSGESEVIYESLADDTATSETGKVEVITGNGSMRSYKGVTVIGDTGYSFFGYNEELMKGYTDALKKLADELEGISTVYSVPIPMSGGITFPDNFASEQTYTVQKDALNRMDEMFTDKVRLVNMNDIFMQHRREYLYFRTDHHWTALGAYYAYTVFCEEKGIQAEMLDSYETMVFDNFHGTYTFGEDGAVQDQELYDHPDTVTEYLPHDPSTLHIINRDGSEFDWQVICDVTNYGSASKYVTFGVGDYPLATVHNENKHDGSACIVVKDSFGNAFVPFLVDHYEYIYGIDYRYGREKLVSFAKEHNVQDILFVVSMQNTCNSYAVGRMQELCR